MLSNGIGSTRYDLRVYSTCHYGNICVYLDDGEYLDDEYLDDEYLDEDLDDDGYLDDDEYLHDDLDEYLDDEDLDDDEHLDEEDELLTQEDDDNILSVIGILFEISEEPNPTIDKILTEQVLEGVSTFNNEGYTNLLSLYYTQFNLTKLLPENKEYISYKGSLTTPPCFETVRWLL